MNDKAKYLEVNEEKQQKRPLDGTSSVPFGGLKEVMI